MRGTPQDYDGWRDQGNPGWGWDDVLPYFKRSERHYLGETALHGGSGELSVSPLHEPHPASAAFVQSARSLGIPATDDFNGPSQEGVGYLQLMIRDGVRASSSSAFLRPALGRPNLKLEINALAERILFEGARATGIQYSVEGQTRRAGAGELIVCGGAINSPQLLLLSGVGPADALQRLGIQVRQNLPGVGQNLHDHV